MMGPAAGADNRGTICVSPQKGTAGASGATSTGPAGAAPRVLARPQIHLRHEITPRRSSHGLRNSIPEWLQENFRMHGTPESTRPCRSLIGGFEPRHPSGDLL